MKVKDNALVVEHDETFAQSDTDFITENFVCAICHADLQVVFLPNEARVLIVCIEHGNVCDCGRVTHATVSIEMERAARRYHEAIRNLPDLWGSLIEDFITDPLAHSIVTFCVCRVCGNSLQSRPIEKGVEVYCRKHGNINKCGYIDRTKFKFDSEYFTTWEKENMPPREKRPTKDLIKELTGN